MSPFPSLPAVSSGNSLCQQICVVSFAILTCFPWKCCECWLCRNPAVFVNGYQALLRDYELPWTRYGFLERNHPHLVFWKPAKNHPDLRNWNSKSSSTSWTGAGDGMVEILAPVNRRMEDLSRWWFQICFYVHPYLGKIPILTNIFQMGWNQQPAANWFSFRTFEASTVWESLVFGPFSILQKTRGARGTFKFFAGGSCHPNVNSSLQVSWFSTSHCKCGLLPPAKKRSNSPQIQEFNKHKVWRIDPLDSNLNWDVSFPRLRSQTQDRDSRMAHIRGFEKLNQNESTSFFPWKTLIKDIKLCPVWQWLKIWNSFHHRKKERF